MQLIESTLQTYAPYGLALLGLVLADLLFGVASALRRRVFSWRKVTDFYIESIIPKVLGWFAAVILTYALTSPVLPAEVVDVVGTGVAGSLWLITAGSLIRSISSNLAEIQAA